MGKQHDRRNPRTRGHPPRPAISRWRKILGGKDLETVAKVLGTLLVSAAKAWRALHAG